MDASKTAQQAVDRTLVLGVLAFRSRFEGVRFGGEAGCDAETAAAMAGGVTEWLREASLWGATLGPERALLGLPALGWSKQDVVAVQSAALEESVGALLMALGALDGLPPYDQRVDADLVLHRLPFLSDSPFVTREGMAAAEEYASMSRAVKLESRARIEEEERRAGAYWWRARSHTLVRARHLDGARLAQILKDGASHTRALRIPVDGAGEFLLFGGRYANLTGDQAALGSLLAEARLRALRWLLSDADWMSVDMSS